MNMMLSLVASLASAWSCTEDQRVEASLEVWRTVLARARDRDIDLLLGQLRLGPIPSDLQDAKLGRVDIVEADLSGEAEPERIVHARFTARLRTGPGNDRSDLVRLDRFQVLQPLGDDAFCALGNEMSRDQAAETWNGGPGDTMRDTWEPLTWTLTRLTRPDRETVEIVERRDVVARSVGTVTDHTFWEVDDGHLVLVLSLREFKSTCRACGAPRQRAWFERVGAPPQTVRQHWERCPEGAGYGDARCLSRTTEQVWSGRTYR